MRRARRRGRAIAGGIRWAGTGRTAAAAAAAGTAVKRLRRVRLRRTVSACMTCRAMYRNGSRTAGTMTMRARRRTAALGWRAVIAGSAYCAAVRGATYRGSSVPPSASGTASGTGSSPSASALPGRLRLESSLVYLGGPGAEPPAGLFRGASCRLDDYRHEPADPDIARRLAKQPTPT